MLSLSKYEGRRVMSAFNGSQVSSIGIVPLSRGAPLDDR
jgi:hypothetical protein